MNGNVDWNGIRDFLAVVEAGSITAASEKLLISQPTLSRRLKTLEETLGVQLLVRGPRHLRLTEAGQKFWQQAQKMGVAAKALDDGASIADDAMAGPVRVSATEGLAVTWLTDQLARFMRRHPGITVELVIDNHFTDLLDRDADIAVRLVRPTQKDLITSHVATLGIGFFAHAEYVARFGAPERQADLVAHRVIGLVGTRRFPMLMERALTGGQFVFRTRNVIGALRAVQAGIGIGPAFNFMGHAAEDCVQVLTAAPPIREPVWLTALPEYRDNARIRATYQFLADAFRNDEARLTDGG